MRKKGRFKDIVLIEPVVRRGYYGCDCDECSSSVPVKDDNDTPPACDVTDNVHRNGKCVHCRKGAACKIRKAIREARQQQPIPLLMAILHRSGESVTFNCGELHYGPEYLLKKLAAIRQLRKQVKDKRLAKKATPIKEIWTDRNQTIREFGMIGFPGERYHARELLARKDKTWKIWLAERDFGPLGPDRHVGIEIECGTNLSRSNLVQAFANANLAMRVTVVGDGSLSFDHKASCEVRVCDKESRINETIDRVCKVLKNARGEANSSCGLHIHLDMRARNWEKCYQRLYSALTWLYAVVDPQRHNNTYCRRPPKAPSMGNRYYAINAAAIGAHNTLEVRLHHGTVDPERIKNWIRLLITIIDGPDTQRVPRTLKGMAKRYKLPKELQEYVIQRVKEFGGNGKNLLGDVVVPELEPNF